MPASEMNRVTSFEISGVKGRNRDDSGLEILKRFV
jgi:hypothetical protein